LLALVFEADAIGDVAAPVATAALFSIATLGLVVSALAILRGWSMGMIGGIILLATTGFLMDDAWQKALFTQEMTDLPRDMLVALMANVAGCADGRFHEIEADFYKRVEDVNRSFDLLQMAS